MSVYESLRPLFFALPAESAHALALYGLDAAAALRLGPRLSGSVPDDPVTLMGLRFPNRVGLAAGLDKNGDHLRGLASLGFGFVEIGTVTPRPQPGNPKPRLFRLPEHRAIINRMGFNNKGVAHLARRVERSGYDGVLGINIGKNKDTPNERAFDDYRVCLDTVYPLADYITVNLSSPNTPGLRDLQFGEPLQRLLAALKERQAALRARHGRYVPLTVKLAPDMAEPDLIAVAETLREHGIDGVIATNTTVTREGVAGHRLADETGGLSGAPVKPLADAALKTLTDVLGDAVPVVGVGGILSGRDACDKRDRGAALVQLYSGLIYRGPALVGEVARALAAHPAHPKGPPASQKKGPGDGASSE